MMACKKYVLVDWNIDHSVSVVPATRLKSRDGNSVTQKWPDGEYCGVILEESGKLLALSCIFMQVRLSLVCR